MDPRTLQLIQRGLVAAVTVVLALVVITAFVRVLRSSDDTAAGVTTTSTTTTSTTTPEETTTTVAPSAVTSTTGPSAVIPAVCTDEEPSQDDVTVLRVFYPCGPNPLATGQAFIYRAVPPTDLVLTTTMRELVKGVDDEEVALGYRSPFPDDADGSFLGATIDREEGRAFLEFTNDVFPDGVDTPEGAQIFLSTLNANVFKFDNIRSVEYRLSGSCDAFWQQLGGSCEIITRADWQAQAATG